MNDTTITICGNVVDDPRLRTTGNGLDVANFRIASTPRRFDREKGAFVDNRTLYITVTAWRQFGRNVAASLRKGQPVVVTGRLTMREYEVEGQPRSSYELDANSIGHDLARGTTEFTRVYATPSTVSVPVDGDGVPSDDSDYFLGLVNGSGSLPPEEDDGAGEFSADRAPEPALAG